MATEAQEGFQPSLYLKLSWSLLRLQMFVHLWNTHACQQQFLSREFLSTCSSSSLPQVLSTRKDNSHHHHQKDLLKHISFCNWLDIISPIKIWWLFLKALCLISAIWLDISDLRLAKGTLWTAFKHWFKVTSPCPSWRLFTNLLKAFTLLWFLLLPAMRNTAFACSKHCTFRSKTRKILKLLYLKFLLMCSLTNSLQHKLRKIKGQYIYVLSLLTVMTWVVFENSASRSQRRWSVSRSPHGTGMDRIHSEAGSTLQILHNSAHSCLCLLHYPPPQFTRFRRTWMN